MVLFLVMLLTSTINTTKRKSYTPTVAPHSLFKPGRTKGIVANQIQTLEETIKKLTKQSTDIKDELFNLRNSRGSQNSQQYLIDLYQKKILQLTEIVQNRNNTVNALENKLGSFIQVGPQARIPAQNQQNQQFDLSLERQILMNEHKHLTENCIYNDRLMVLYKIKLRICHDHRDLFELQRAIECLKTGSNDVFIERAKEKRTRQRIANLKRMIEAEKRRIAQIENSTKEEESAILIQKTWRGYNQRRKEKLKKKHNTPKYKKHSHHH